MIETKDLTKTFDNFTAVDSLNLKIEKGEFFGLLGPNGAGKTTTISLLSTLLLPTKGEILIDGQQLTRQRPDLKRKISVITQEYSMRQDMNMDEIMEYQGRLYFMPRKEIKRKTEELLDFCGLLPFRKRTVRKLSGGMKRKLMVCRALLTSPEILLLDEPTNHLDSAMADWLEEYLKRFKGALLMITHDRYFLDRVVRRIFALEDTRMVQYEGGYTDYANRKAAEGNTESTGTAAASQPKNADEETTSKNWKNGQKRKLKFTYQEQKDYESIEGEMAALEDKIATLEADFSKYASDFVKLNELTKEKEAAEQQLEEKMERWMYLEDLAARIAEQ